MSAGVTIGPLVDADTDAVTDLYRTCFPADWNAGAIAGYLRVSDTWGLLARVPGIATPVGYAVARSVGGEAELFSIGVAISHRRQGVGRNLVEAVAARAAGEGAEVLLLEVARGNVAARAMYGRLGFEVVGERPSYYRAASGAAEAAVMMRLKLAGERHK